MVFFVYLAINIGKKIEHFHYTLTDLRALKPDLVNKVTKIITSLYRVTYFLTNNLNIFFFMKLLINSNLLL